MIGGTGAGRVLPQGASPRQWADAVTDITSDRSAYALISDAAFDRAHDHLSWERWADGVVQDARQALGDVQERGEKVAISA